MSAMLSPREVDEFVRVNAALKALQRRHDALRDKLVAQLRKGAASPPSHPYELFVVRVERVAVDWRAHWRVTVRQLMDEVAASKLEAVILSETPTKVVESLRVRPNVGYALGTGG